MLPVEKLFPYKFNKKYETAAAYFSMEFAIDQSLKIYSGGLGFLAASHMRSAYELRQNLVGIGILWKYGYYDQHRNKDGSMKVEFTEKNYSFLTDTEITFPILIHDHVVTVKVYLLEPEVFNTAPIFLLSTDVEENDFLARTISHRLYDNNEQTRIAQSILLGVGGAKLLDILKRKTSVYHLNEGSALPLCYYLLGKYGKLEDVRKRVVFTTHTPEKAGNEEHDTSLLDEMSFFQNLDDVQRSFVLNEPRLNYTLEALRFSKRANGVSKLHAVVSNKMWGDFKNIAEIIPISNAQNKTYWMDQAFEQAMKNDDTMLLRDAKLAYKKQLFRIVADQTGKLFDPNVLTIVWSRRFAAYKRADLVLHNFDRFLKILNNEKQPVQMIWAGKPYPEDITAVALFNKIQQVTRPLKNCAILTGYELDLSLSLKLGSDVWLNTPEIYREASGTSGMTAAMNGSVNLSIADGWIPEFAKHGKNCFIFNYAEADKDRNRIESENLYNVLEKELIPVYYKQPAVWNKILLQAMKDVVKEFDSNRMTKEYFEKLYDFGLTPKKTSKKKVIAD